MTLRLAYLLEDTDISGSVAAALGQADALVARGHRVRIVTKGSPVTWRTSRAEWVYVDHFQQYDASGDDFVIATAEPATNVPPGRAVDLKEVAVVGRIVDDLFYRDRLPRENAPLRVLLSGQSQIETKGIHEGYGAVAHARWFHQKFDFIRVSAWAPERDEPLDTVQEFHVALNISEMTRLVHSCDVLIAPNHREERFGLPAAEALAAGLATVMTSIPAFLAFDAKQDFTLFAPADNAVELGEKLIELLSDDDLRQRLRERGREVAEQWRAHKAAERLEQYFRDRSSRAP